MNRNRKMNDFFIAFLFYQKKSEPEENVFGSTKSTRSVRNQKHFYRIKPK